MLRRKGKQGSEEEDQAGPFPGLRRFSPHELTGHLLWARHYSSMWDTAKHETDLAGVLDHLPF